MNRKKVMIGAGGHARVIYDSIQALRYPITGGNAEIYYIDELVPAFFNAIRITDAEAYAMKDELVMVMGIGGVTPAQLQRRYMVFERYTFAGFSFPFIVHPSAVISIYATLLTGVTVGPGAIVNVGALVKEGVIINSGAIIEYDVVIQQGAHVCPGAIILGGATVGKHALIGAGAVVLPGAVVPDGFLVKAQSRYPEKNERRDFQHLL